MHHASIGLRAIALGQNARHILIGGAGMDDQRQASFLRGLDMQAEADLLRLSALGRVMVIKARLANADHLGMACEINQLL